MRKYRIIFSIDFEFSEIEILQVDNRETVYKRLKN